MCAAAIDQAAVAGITFWDSARMSCGSALVHCAQDAQAHGRALSAVRFTSSGAHTCLVV